MIKIFPTATTKALDAYTIEHEPISSFDLMERAARAISAELQSRWEEKDTPFVFFAGPGNNGGDALAVARLLGEAGYTRLTAYLFQVKDTLSEDCRANFELLQMMPQVELTIVTNSFVPPTLTMDHVVVDGLFGSGLNKPLTGGFASVVRFLNTSKAYKVAIDMPSGLMGEDNTDNSTFVLHADLTLTLGQPKLSFFFAECQPYIGEWKALDIRLSEEGISELETPYLLEEDEDFEYMLRPRNKFAHKGDFGRALLIAGQNGMAGASILAAKACLRSGVGLLTVHVPFCNNAILQTAVPEAMTHVDQHEVCFSVPVDTDHYQALGIGPGLGRNPETEQALLEQIEISEVPMVIDADAINLLEKHRNYLGRLPKNSILTPHPKELERLIGPCKNSYERLKKARELAMNVRVHIVIKGAYTTIVTPDGTCYLNPSGNPGMATGGSGDVLTGILLALLAQGYDATTATRLGVYVHGVAGDLAAKKEGETGMIASDIVASLPTIWKMI